MFTGIIQHVGVIKKTERRQGSLFLTVTAPRGWKFKPGDSIAADGVCLTVQKVSKGFYTTELMPETLKKTTFGKSFPATVNLERPLKFGARLDGHLVQGHVDGVGKIEAVKKNGLSHVVAISFPQRFKKLIVSKGSIAVDGVSLTVVRVKKNVFSVALVSYTIKHTTLGKKKAGDLVNLEFDILRKYAKRTNWKI